MFGLISHNCRTKLNLKTIESSRSIFHWLTIIFNRVDHERIQAVGPDRSCAEWLLRNGAFVKWVGAKNFLKDYNTFPSEDIQLYIEKIDATGSSISHHGFLHLQGCQHIRDIKLKNCEYIEDDALRQLSFVKNSLERLAVINCGNITNEGINYLKDLPELKKLELFKLMYVNDKPKILNELKASLPNCQIDNDFEK